jgi:hypothetical protein
MNNYQLFDIYRESVMFQYGSLYEAYILHLKYLGVYLVMIKLRVWLRMLCTWKRVVEVLVGNKEGKLSMKKWFILKLKRKLLQCILNRNEYLLVQVGRFVEFGSFYLIAFDHMLDIEIIFWVRGRLSHQG